jgi:hypothetical protein
MEQDAASKLCHYAIACCRAASLKQQVWMDGDRQQVNPKGRLYKVRYFKQNQTSLSALGIQ